MCLLLAPSYRTRCQGLHTSPLAPDHTLIHAHAHHTLSRAPHMAVRGNSHYYRQKHRSSGYLIHGSGGAVYRSRASEESFCMRASRIEPDNEQVVGMRGPQKLMVRGQDIYRSSAYTEVKSRGRGRKLAGWQPIDPRSVSGRLNRPLTPELLTVALI